MSIVSEEPLRIFGTDHSPWTQAVVLAAVAQGVAARLQPYPVRLDSFLRHGLVMPVCRWPNGEVTSDSLSIILRLQDAESGPAVERDQRALEKLFLSYVLDRAGPGRWWAFVQAWSRKRDAPHTVLSVTIRALLCWYFVSLLWLGRLQLRSAGGSSKAPERMKQLLAEWEGRLQDGPFLAGQEPGAIDFGLLGQMECMASGPTDWTLAIVAEFPQLMAWLARMHERVAPHDVVYSRRMFDAALSTKQATDFESSWFCLCFVLWPVLLWKLVIPFLILSWLLRFRNPNRSASRLMRNGGT